MKKLNVLILSLLLGGGVSAQVGIGTTSPSNALDLESNSDTATAVDINCTGTGDPKINLQPSNYQQSLEEEYVLPQSVGKSFGNLPIVKDDGYSPNRRWVSNLRAKSTGAYYGKDGYAYVLKTNPDYLPDRTRKFKIQDKLSLNDERFENNLEPLSTTPP